MNEKIGIIENEYKNERTTIKKIQGMISEENIKGLIEKLNIDKKEGEFLLKEITPIIKELVDKVVKDFLKDLLENLSKELIEKFSITEDKIIENLKRKLNEELDKVDKKDIRIFLRKVGAVDFVTDVIRQIIKEDNYFPTKPAVVKYLLLTGTGVIFAYMINSILNKGQEQKQKGTR